MVAADVEGQQRAVRVSDVDGAPVVDLDHRHPAAIDESSVERTVVDGQPLALVVAQQQVGARDQRVRDAHVGSQIAPDDHVVARGEGTFRAFVMDG
ncbi:hypothetical protein RE97_01495 [Mycobacterium avium subsp. paratuberculosis]|nr:hypothetical protein RE97_01495 [Mycobacterium avium subsp. paratuberculosis]